MQTFNSFQELQAGTSAKQSNMSVFNATQDELFDQYVAGGLSRKQFDKKSKAAFHMEMGKYIRFLEKEVGNNPKYREVIAELKRLHESQ